MRIYLRNNRRKYVQFMRDKWDSFNFYKNSVKIERKNTLAFVNNPVNICETPVFVAVFSNENLFE